jgi:hypothetical protein
VPLLLLLHLRVAAVVDSTVTMLVAVVHLEEVVVETRNGPVDDRKGFPSAFRFSQLRRRY